MLSVHLTMSPAASRCSNSSGDSTFSGFGFKTTVLPSTCRGKILATPSEQSPSGIGPNTARASSPNLVTTLLLADAGAQKISLFQRFTVSAKEFCLGPGRSTSIKWRSFIRGLEKGATAALHARAVCSPGRENSDYSPWGKFSTSKMEGGIAVEDMRCAVG